MKVLLVAVDAKFIHKSIAVWYLKSYCNHFGMQDISIFETTINESKEKILESILNFHADVIGFSCYIWNIKLVEDLCEQIKKLRPDIKIILGGPEMDDAVISQDKKHCDIVIIGSGEKSLLNILISLQKGNSVHKVVFGEDVKLSEIPSPYTEEYFESLPTLEKERKIKLIYYESSRGCPYCCAYCLSGKTRKVDYLETDRVKSDIKRFLDGGARTVKFIDRTFNADKKRTYELLQFISALDTEATFHFEVSADLFDEPTISLIQSLPHRRVQFEIGVQSTYQKALTAVDRFSDVSKILQRSAEIIKGQNCQVHIDLIAGLPYEDLATFIKSFNDCIAIRPHKLQLGFLKLLKGSKIRAQSEQYHYQYSAAPPYEIICNDYVSKKDLELLKSAEEVLNKFYNKPMFYHSVKHLLDTVYADSSFQFFADFAAFSVNLSISSLPLKQCYTLLLNFMRQKMDNSLAEHLIKLDVLFYDPKNALPDDIVSQRNVALQKSFLASHPNYKRVRVEYFSHIQKHIAFLYDKRIGAYSVFPYEIL